MSRLRSLPLLFLLTTLLLLLTLTTLPTHQVSAGKCKKNKLDLSLNKQDEHAHKKHKKLLPPLNDPELMKKFEKFQKEEAKKAEKKKKRRGAHAEPLFPAPTAPAAPSSPAEPAAPASPLRHSPWFCHSRDCPPFTTRNDSSLYETRVYSEGISFAYTWIRGRSLETATYKGTKRLYAYRGGENSAGVHLEMTTPIATTVYPGLSSNFYVITYYLPHTHQRDPPKPTDEHVRVFTTNYTITLAVREFGGWAWEDRALDELAKLQRVLRQEKVKYCPHVWLLAQYDNPMRIARDRHNEVALVIKQKEEMHEEDGGLCKAMMPPE